MSFFFRLINSMSELSTALPEIALVLGRYLTLQRKKNKIVSLKENFTLFEVDFIHRNFMS